MWCRGKVGAGKVVDEGDVGVFVVVDELRDGGAGLAPDVGEDGEGHGLLGWGLVLE